MDWAARIEIGKHYFTHDTKRTDAFARKRYTNPEVERYADIYIMVEALRRTPEKNRVVVKVCTDGEQQPDFNGEYEISALNLLDFEGGSELRTLEDHGEFPKPLGVWVERQKS